MPPRFEDDPLVRTPPADKYRKVAPLSSGSFGFVILYEDLETNEEVAIKFLERGDAISKYVEGEILNHRLLRHYHVIKFKVRSACKRHGDGGLPAGDVLSCMHGGS